MVGGLEVAGTARGMEVVDSVEGTVEGMVLDGADQGSREDEECRLESGGGETCRRVEGVGIPREVEAEEGVDGD
jgi:hypothetical protein